MASVEKRPPAEIIPKKPTLEKNRRAPDEGLKRKQGEIEVKESKKPKRAIDEKKNSDTEEFEVGEDLGRFFINEFCLITDMKCLSNAKFDNDDDTIKLGLLYMIFCIPLANANSVKIDPKYFALADNLEEFNAFLWVVLSCITGFPHVLLIWAYESIPTKAGKFTIKYVEANPRMLSWTSADNVKFDAVMSALTTVGRKHPKCFVMMPTDEELKEQCVAQLYLKNPTVVPQAPRKTLGNPTTTYHVSYRHKRNVQKDDSDATKIDSDDLRFGPQDDRFVDSDIIVIADKGVKVVMDLLNTDKEEGDDEKEIAEDEDDKGENDEYEEGEEGKAKENDEEKYESGKGNEEEKNPNTAKEKKEEKEDEEAKGKEEERKNEEAVKEQDESINDVKRSRLSRLGQERFGPVVEIDSPAHAPMNVKFYALPRGLSDESPREKLEQFRSG
ncbi:hypothetical protein TIFTF001_017167 [Ficus carica]|uniref:Uncharacterized protein n=1 Tax=Ficus carica TaxID=3494 RepID=A0AA88AA40_FICCA|nr:hypothetical protein TIFTF001_017167 [Ficus carica]